MKIDIKIVESEKELESALKIRERVFITGQKVPEEIERDGREGEAIHILVWDDEKISSRNLNSDTFVYDEKAIGTARLRPLGEKTAKLERMALLPEYRGKGLGKKMWNFLMKIAKNKGIEKVTLHSQEHAIDFYRKLGFKPKGEKFMEAGIPHVEMFREI